MKKIDAQNDCENRVYGPFPYTLINQNEYNNESEWVLMMNIVKYACSILFNMTACFLTQLRKKLTKFI